MNKKVISLVAALVFVLGLASFSFAADWGEIIYGGYVAKYIPQPGVVMVDADTGIWVFNPNNFVIGCRMQVIDKMGAVLNANVLLYDGGMQVSSIPPGGHIWITLGMVPQIPEGVHKYTFRLLFSGQAGRAPVVEVKEAIYVQREYIEIIDGHVLYNPIYNPPAIKTWSEAALGGPYGTGKFKP